MVDGRSRAPVPEPEGPTDRSHPAGDWRTDGTSMVKESDGDGWHATLRATPDDRGVTLEAEIRYSAPVLVSREAILFTLPGRARALGRDLRVAPLARTLRIDRGTPIFLATAATRRQPGAAVVAEEGIPAARFSPHVADSDVELVMDDPGTHPFSSFATCRSDYLPHLPGVPAPRRPDPEMERRTRHDHITRAAGEVVRARAQIYVIGDGEEFLPVIVERWAAGARAAVVFTDHADRTDPEALRAVLYGVSDRHAPCHGCGGFFGHGIKITKTFFVRPGIGTLEDPDAVQLASEIVAHGGEIGSHSITPQRDLRQVVADALTVFSLWRVVTWIDHQPDTNCEAISSRGWKDDANYGIHDLLAGAGFQWVWSGSDAPAHTLRVGNLFEPEQAGAAVPPIYPLPSDPRLWVFESIWFYDRVARMAAAFGEADLDRLEHERGLFIAHTYLSASPRTTRRRELIGRDAVVARPEGGLALDPAFEEALTRLGARVARGAISSLTLRESGDRLRDLGAIAVRYQADGSALVTNTGGVAVKALTLAIPADVQIELRGAPPGGTGGEPGRTTVWFDLPAGRSVVVSARAAPPAAAPVNGDQAGAVPLGVTPRQVPVGGLP